ncbi:hypothetical protein AVEN_41395-1 [Araneus ventricosus]|uniref:Uncharacterized protein n=1 Tax=Araneus ventricosus TaxID=182803 RepID=A0A4Y2B9G3_ARAVE|nr:hypothetical protein AVEN_41395-1 [Araneus ventricosus]
MRADNPLWKSLVGNARDKECSKSDRCDNGGVNVKLCSFKLMQLIGFSNEKSCPCLLSHFSASVFTSFSEENLVPDKYSFNFEKRKQSRGRHEAIRLKRRSILSDGVIVSHDNTRIARKTQEFLQKFKCDVWSHPHTAQIWNPIWVPNTYLEQGSLRQRCENICRELAQWAGPSFLSILLSKNSDKCLTRIGDYVGK